MFPVVSAVVTHFVKYLRPRLINTTLLTFQQTARILINLVVYNFCSRMRKTVSSDLAYRDLTNSAIVLRYLVAIGRL